MVCPLKRKKVRTKKGKNEIEKANETAFRFLSYCPRSVEEVKRKLEEKGFSPLTIKKTLARVKELGYTNDRDYAYVFACSSIKNKQWGTMRIYSVLLSKGVSQEIANQTVARIKKEFDMNQVARQAFEIRFAHFGPHERFDEKTRNRAVNYLRRKGFSWDTIYTVIKSSIDLN